MASYHCQICSMAMSIARIRTPSDPPDTAWSYKGHTYVGFGQFQDIYGDAFPDQHCEQCTTLDRTPATLDEDIKNAGFGPLWPDEQDEDHEWLPEEDSDARSEKLEYDSEADSDVESSDTSQYDDRDSDDGKNDTNIHNALLELHAPPEPKHLPHGTLHKGYMYTREWQIPQYLGDLLQKRASGSYRLPLEHIAARSCKSLQGINGHVLSAEQMKGCRNHRFLLAKPLDWQADESDNIFESGSLFVLSGESNGSYISPVDPYVYPPRYGVDRVHCWTLYVNDGCNDSDGWQPLPVHSYCLDIFAKVSYRRLGRVDLNGIWHWREMQCSPESYNLTEDDVSTCPEVARGRRDHGVWSHQPGDEWLAANPVEVPELCSLVESCFSSVPLECTTNQHSQARLLRLPAELIDYIICFLEESDLNIVAATCRQLRRHTQSFFKVLAVEHMSWLWEVFEAERYPSSPDWPVTWDPCNPPGLVIPHLPHNLPSEKQETALWEEILKDDPDMENVGNAVKASNTSRREVILGPYRARVAQSLQEWRDFRGGVADWICRRPLSKDRVAHDGLDWTTMFAYKSKG
ncbi:hypothetical protein yc1106_00378 [Curvularia clavata]|uniref:F-box domain-containing protein n=1 Tax=Curvularia clavata TaxID=95742 RepID=A0A9Q9DNZ2_CURCL|nr:hypothetical protein yc1106_00378 [Curvularia clavata]